MEITQLSEPSGQSSIGGWLRQFVPIKRSEALTVALLALNCFILLICYYVLKVVREPLILLGGGAELKAYASAGQTILLLGVVPAFSWLSSRVSRIRLMTTMQVIFIGCLVAFYILAQAKAPIGLAFYLWLGVFNVLVVSNFWSFANDLFTEQEGKRVFSLIGFGASIGAIVGAFAPHMLHKVIGIEGLMVVAVAGLGLSIVLYQIVDKRETARKRAVASAKAAEPKPDHESKKGGFALVMKDRYLRLLALMLLVATVINTTGEYVIGKMATDRSEDYAAAKLQHADSAEQSRPVQPVQNKQPDAKAADNGKAEDKQQPDKKADDTKKAAQDEYISRFYSDYYGLVNLISALLQGLLVTRILVKLGVRRALFIMPVIVLGGWISLIVFVNLLTVRIEKTTENSLDYSLHNTLRQALFLPTSKAAKYKAKAAIDTFFFRMGDVIAGLGIVFLFVEVFGLGVRAFAVLNVVLAACWILLARRAGKLHDELAAKSAEAPQESRAA